MIDPLKHRFAALRSRAEFHSLRYVQRSGEYLSVRRNVSEPPHFSQDRGAMLCVRLNGVEAYAATNDLSAAGLQGFGSIVLPDIGLNFSLTVVRPVPVLPQSRFRFRLVPPAML
ncbi:hypothetical protein P6U18_24075, partial [Pseudomonas sp. L01]|nr:hypothetical protein [Pseudomonas sp. L01]